MKFGIREICNVVLKAKTAAPILGKTFKAGQPVLWFDSLKTSGLEGTGEIVYARGGRGNTKLIAWEGDRDVTFTMEDALLSPMSLALLTAGSLTKASENKVIVKHITEEVLSDSTGNVTFTYQPSDKYPVFADMSAVTVSNKVATVTAKNTIVKLDYYIEAASKITQIDIAPDAFGANFYLEAETLFRDEKGIDHAAEFIIPSCRVQSNFSFNMSSSGDPSTFTFTMDAFPDTINNGTKKVLCAIQVFEELA